MLLLLLYSYLYHYATCKTKSKFKVDDRTAILPGQSDTVSITVNGEFMWS